MWLHGSHTHEGPGPGSEWSDHFRRVSLGWVFQGLFLYEIGLKTFMNGGESSDLYCYNSHMSRLLYKLLVKGQWKRWSHPIFVYNPRQRQNSEKTDFWGGFYSIPGRLSGMAHRLYFSCLFRVGRARILFDHLSGPVRCNVLSPWGHWGSERSWLSVVHGQAGIGS